MTAERWRDAVAIEIREVSRLARSSVLRETIQAHQDALRALRRVATSAGDRQLADDATRELEDVERHLYAQAPAAGGGQHGWRRRK